MSNRQSDDQRDGSIEGAEPEQSDPVSHFDLGSAEGVDDSEKEEGDGQGLERADAESADFAQKLEACAEIPSDQKSQDDRDQEMLDQFRHETEPLLPPPK